MSIHVIRNQETGNVREFEDASEAKKQFQELQELADNPDDVVLVESKASNSAQNAPEAVAVGDGESPSEVVEAAENDTRADVVDINQLPKISPVEEKAREIISHLGPEDMKELVWNPDANPYDVPYNPQDLPYNSPTPSAEAFNLFATVLEGTQGIQYSVVDVDFEKTEETLGCMVIIEKEGQAGTKRLPGIKTRTRRNKDLDHWRERLYSKARRNALKQDIPPTFVSALMARFRELDR